MSEESDYFAQFPLTWYICLSAYLSVDAGHQILWHGCTKLWMNKRMTVSWLHKIVTSMIF